MAQRKHRIAVIPGDGIGKETTPEGLRVLAVTLHPVMPKATTSLWESLGAEPALGALPEQRIDEVAQWGRLPEGATITKVPSLFPRIDLAEA